MKTRFVTTGILTLFTVLVFAGDLEGLWRNEQRNMNIEVLYTRNGIKVRSADRGNDWNEYRAFDNNRYRDNFGNCYSFNANGLEYCTADRSNIINFSRYNPVHNGYDNGRYGSENDWNRGHDQEDRWDNRWGRDNRRNRDHWIDYYRNYEGRWHNHTTGQRINVDFDRGSLRIKFQGNRWFDVQERNRGLFVDQRGNQFYFANDGIEYRSYDGDLNMKFYNDDRCLHREDFRSDYWR